MNITLATYQSVSLLHGGPRVQILQTKNELEKLGVNVSLFQPWESFDKKSCDLVHLFSANLGTFHLASVLNNFTTPFVSSSIFYTEHSPAYIRSILTISKILKKIKSGIWTSYDYTQQICGWSKAVMPNTGAEGKLLREGLMIPLKKYR